MTAMSANGASPQQAKAFALSLFDGRSSQARPVLLQIDEHSAQILCRQTGQNLLKIPLQKLHKQMRLPEGYAKGARIIELTQRAPLDWQNAQLHAAPQDREAFDAWVRTNIPAQANASASLVARAQQSWRGVAVAFALLLASLVGLYLYGLPVAARGITALVPWSADEAIGRNALEQIDGRWMKPSKLSLADQTRIRERFLAGVKKQYPKDTPPNPARIPPIRNRPQRLRPARRHHGDDG
ncbi:MAG: hypothetical protein HC858_00930 [Brachymonas sp.]|nr:hypothetical protein [Brachymonas sp.]